MKKRTKKSIVSSRLDTRSKPLEVSPKTEAVANALVVRAAEALLQNQKFKTVEQGLRENTRRLELIEAAFFELARLMHTKGLIHLPDHMRTALEKQSGKLF